MATFLSLTNSVLARLNEVQLTSSNFSNARGIQVQAQNAVNESIRYINQREFQYPFNHTTHEQLKERHSPCAPQHTLLYRDQHDHEAHQRESQPSRHDLLT